MKGLKGGDSSLPRPQHVTVYTKTEKHTSESQWRTTQHSYERTLFLDKVCEIEVMIHFLCGSMDFAALSQFLPVFSLSPH